MSKNRGTPDPGAAVTHVLDDLDARGLVAHATDRDALREALSADP